MNSLLVLKCIALLIATTCGTKQNYGESHVTSPHRNEEQELDHLLSLADHQERETDKPLRCYTCVSTESWEDCEKHHKIATCPEDSTSRCIAASITVRKPGVPSVTEYFKSCVTANKCDPQHFPACRAGTVQCSLQCCDGMYCNKDRPVVSKGIQRKDETAKSKTILSTNPTPAPLNGFAIVCLPHAMHIQISRKQLEKMTSLKLNPSLLHLNDPECGVAKVSDTHVILSTPLNACGTERRRSGDSLTFANKVFGQRFSDSAIKRDARTPQFQFPFKCSYTKVDNVQRQLDPPVHAYSVEQW